MDSQRSETLVAIPGNPRRVYSGYGSCRGVRPRSTPPGLWMDRRCVAGFAGGTGGGGRGADTSGGGGSTRDAGTVPGGNSASSAVACHGGVSSATCGRPTEERLDEPGGLCVADSFAVRASSCVEVGSGRSRSQCTVNPRVRTLASSVAPHAHRAAFRLGSRFFIANHPGFLAFSAMGRPFTTRGVVAFFHGSSWKGSPMSLKNPLSALAWSAAALTAALPTSSNLCL